MKEGHLHVRRALQIVPDLEELRLFRGTVLETAQEDRDLAGTGAAGMATLDVRRIDPQALEQRLEEMADAARARAARLHERALEALRAADQEDWAGAARALVAAGEEEEGERRLDTAEHLYRSALELARKPRDRSVEGLAWRRLGRVARLAGRLDEAVGHYRRGLEVAEAERDRKGMIVACQGLGNIAVDRGGWEEARGWYERGLSLAGEGEQSRFHWQLYNNLSVVALRTGELDACRVWLERADRVVERIGDGPGVMAVLNNRGRYHTERGEPERAAEVYREGLAGDPGPFTRCALMVNLAESLVAADRLEAAEETARQAEATAIRHGLILSLVNAYRTLGTIARHREDPEGFLFFEQALELCRAHRLPEMEEATTQYEYGLADETLGQVEAARARYGQALEVYERLEAAEDERRARQALTRVEAPNETTPRKDG